MKRPIREKQYICGSYLEVDLYTLFASQKGRRKKKKPSSDVQTRLNKRNAERRLIRLINTNFMDGDLKLELTYDPEHYPEDFSYEDALKEVQKFLRRLKYRYQKLGIEFKYIVNVERGKRNKRLHHHIIIPKGLDISEISECWNRGTVRGTALRMGPQGAAGLAVYFSKDPEGSKRWHASKGLRQPDVHIEDETREEKEQTFPDYEFSGYAYTSRNIADPVVRTSTGKISQKLVKEWAELGFDARSSIEKKYPGYILTEVKPYYNDINKSWYVTLLMYRKDAPKKKRGRSSSGSGAASRSSAPKERRKK